MDIVLMFFVYAFIGWITEVFYHYIKHKRFVNRGFLHGPIVPIYGLSAVSLHLFAAYYFTEVITSNLLFIAIIFLTIFIISSLFELIGGSLLMHFFGARWWDYSHMKYSIKGFVSLHFSLAWGFFGTGLFVGFHQPILLPLLSTIDTETKSLFATILLTVYVIDTVFTLFALMNFKSLLLQLKNNVESLKQNSEYLQGSKEKSNLNAFRNNIGKIIQGLKNHESFKKVENKVDQIRLIVPEQKDLKPYKAYESIKRITTKISNTRLYRAFPNLRIALRRKENIKNGDDDEK